MKKLPLLLVLACTSLGLSPTSSFADDFALEHLEDGSVSYQEGENTTGSMSTEFPFIEGTAAVMSIEINIAKNGFDRFVSGSATVSCSMPVIINLYEDISKSGQEPYTAEVVPNIDIQELEPVIDAARRLTVDRCPEVTEMTLNSLLFAGVGKEFTQDTIFIAATNGWGQSDLTATQDCPLNGYVPPQGKTGLIPVNDACPNNLFVSELGVVSNPERDWELYVHSVPVEYELVDHPTLAGRQSISAFYDGCPGAPIEMELRLQPSDFGGRSNLPVRIKEEIVANTSHYTSLVRSLLSSSVYCNERPGGTAQKAIISITNLTNNTDELGEVVFDNIGRYFKPLRHKVRDYREEGPFAGIAGAEYLNAIYAGDFELVRYMDQEAGWPYRDALDKFDDYVWFSGVLTGQGDIREIMSQLYEEFSLISSMTASYMLAYERIYPTCLGSTPAEAEQVWDFGNLKLVDGLGNTIVDYSSIDETRITFKAKREHQDILTRVVNTKPEVLNLAGRQFGGTVSTILSATVDGMRRYSCNSSEIVTLERNMVIYWDEWLARTKPITDQLR